MLDHVKKMDWWHGIWVKEKSNIELSVYHVLEKCVTVLLIHQALFLLVDQMSNVVYAIQPHVVCILAILR